MLGLPLRTALLGLLAAVLSLAVSVVGLSAPALAADPAAGPTAAPAGAAGPVKILATGDSITHSRHGDRSWRYWVSRELVRQGVAFDNVGSYTTPFVDPGYPTSTYAVPFDGQHFAYAGQRLSGLATRIKAEVATQQPDVVVLLAGVNDLRGDRDRGFAPAEILARLETALRSYVANVRAARPDAPQPKILVGEVLTSNRTDVVPLVPQVNAMYARVVAELSTPESPITLVRTGAGGWKANASFTFDGLHPNATGETLIAQNMAQGLYAAGVLPAPPARIFHTESWARTERVTVTSSGTRATVSWAHQAVTGGVARLRETGTGKWRLSPLASSGRTTFAVQPGHTYETQVQLRRVWMRGAFGPVTTFRAARTAARPSARPAAPRNAHLTRAGIRWGAVAGATVYDVRFRTAADPAWTSVSTRAPRLTLGPARTAKVTSAQVRSVTRAGVSPWRAARR